MSTLAVTIVIWFLSMKSTLNPRRFVPVLFPFAAVLLGCADIAQAPTRLKLSTIKPGTENVQLVYNGDFQFEGSLVNNTHPFPLGWSRQADMFVEPGTNTVLTDNRVVARAHVDGSSPVCLYQRTISLEPNTAYVL